jgi:hypothetical protein
MPTILRPFKVYSSAPPAAADRLARETFRWEEVLGDNRIARLARDPGRGVRGYTFQKLGTRS